MIRWSYDSHVTLLFFLVVVGEKLLCGFQWDMSGIDVHANTDIGHHTSTLVRTMTTIASDLEGQEKQESRRSSATNLPSPKSQSVRHMRKGPSSSKILHKRSLSVYQKPSNADASYKNALEEELAKQTRRVQQMRYTGATGDSLKMEEQILRTTEQELARTVQRMFRHPRSSISLQVFNQIFGSRSPHERSALQYKTRARLFSVSETPKENVRTSPPNSPIHVPRIPQARKFGHRRYKSDVTGMRGGTPSPSPTPQEGLEEEEGEEGEKEEDVLGGQSVESMEPPHPQNGFSLPSIDLEFDVTVNVDRGKVVLRMEER